MLNDLSMETIFNHLAMTEAAAFKLLESWNKYCIQNGINFTKGTRWSES